VSISNRWIERPGVAAVTILFGLLGCSGGSGSDDGGSGGGAQGSTDSGSTDGALAHVDTRRIGGSDARVNSCPGPITMSWAVDGVPYVSSTVLVGGVGDRWQVTAVECVNDGTDSVLQLVDIPGPIEVGSYPLSFTALHAQPASSEGGATWYVNSNSTSIATETNYFTDSAHTGVLTITAVDTTASTLFGSFSFSAVNDAATHVVQVTDGVLSNVKFPPPQ
jgi:hypothetical protein